jgi:hypothetical protein
MILADVLPEVPWLVTGVVALGLIGLLSIYVLIMAAIAYTRKNFGKQPPLHEQVKTLRDEFMTTMAKHEASVKSEMEKHDRQDALKFTSLEEQVEDVDDDVEQLRSDIATNGERRKTEMLTHIDGVREGLNTKIDEQTTHFNDRLNDMPMQLVALLKNTGAIK